MFAAVWKLLPGPVLLEQSLSCWNCSVSIRWPDRIMQSPSSTTKLIQVFLFWSFDFWCSNKCKVTDKRAMCKLSCYMFCSLTMSFCLHSVTIIHSLCRLIFTTILLGNRYSLSDLNGAAFQTSWKANIAQFANTTVDMVNIICSFYQQNMFGQGNSNGTYPPSTSAPIYAPLQQIEDTVNQFLMNGHNRRLMANTGSLDSGVGNPRYAISYLTCSALHILFNSFCRIWVYRMHDTSFRTLLKPMQSDDGCWCCNQTMKTPHLRIKLQIFTFHNLNRFKWYRACHFSTGDCCKTLVCLRDLIRHLETLFWQLQLHSEARFPALLPCNSCRCAPFSVSL